MKTQFFGKGRMREIRTYGFDEGDVASEKPRRGSLLYKTSIGMKKILIAVVSLIACFQAYSAGKVISVLPEPVGGVYVLGSSTSTDDARAAGASNYDYINWAALNVPSGSTVRLNGAVVLDALPDNLTYDWSTCTRLALVGAEMRAVGKSLVAPASLMRFLAYDGTVTVDGENFSIAKTGALSEYHCATELNTVMETWDGYFAVFYGALTGAESGEIIVNNFKGDVSCYGPLDFDGSFYLGNSQLGQAIRIYTPDESTKVGTVRMHTYDPSKGDNACQSLLYDPQRAAENSPSTLTVGYLDVSGECSGIIDGNDKYRRFGAQICVYSNNTVKIQKFLANKSAVGLFAAKKPFYKNKDMPKSFDFGVGNVSLANGGNMDGRFYVSPNMNVTLREQHGQYPASTQSFYYTVETNVVNQAEFLSFKDVWSYPNDGTLKVYANEPMNLPRNVIGKPQAGYPTRTWLTFNDSTWTMPFDFGASDANPARCETDVKVIIPASGTVYVKNVTTLDDSVYPRKWAEYPIVTYGALEGGDFSEWTVVPVGWPSGTQVEKVVKANGLYVRIRKPRGMALSLR